MRYIYPGFALWYKEAYNKLFIVWKLQLVRDFISISIPDKSARPSTTRSVI